MHKNLKSILDDHHPQTDRHLQKSLLVNTVHSTLQKCRLNLYHEEKRPHVNVKTKKSAHWVASPAVHQAKLDSY